MLLKYKNSIVECTSKITHHGKLAENSEPLFEMVDSEYAVITNSDKNKEEEVVSALEELGTTIYLTREGDIQVSSDGNSIKVVQ